MMDQMGEVEYAPGEAKGTPWHPHRGFETVTYMIDGVFEHQDSHGGGGTHHQRRHPVDDRRLRDPPHRGAAGVAGPSGGLFHGIQLWVNLPRDEEVVARSTRTSLRRGRPPHVVRRGAGPRHRRWTSAAGRPGSTHTPMSLVHATIEPGARLDLPWDNDSTRWSTSSTARHGRHRRPPCPHGPVRRARRRRLPHHHRRPARRAARPSST